MIFGGVVRGAAVVAAISRMAEFVAESCSAISISISFLRFSSGIRFLELVAITALTALSYAIAAIAFSMADMDKMAPMCDNWAEMPPEVGPGRREVSDQYNSNVVKGDRLE